MARKKLNPARESATGRNRNVPPGHDTRSLGPSDSSDSGSDMAGPGLLDDDVLGLDRGTNEDSESGRRNVLDSGPSVGDLGADDNTDRSGTGERQTAGKEQHVRPGADIDVDRVVGGDEAGLGVGLDEAEEALLTDDQREAPPSSRKRWPAS